MGSDPDVAARVDHARREIGTSIDELRDLAHGLRPTLLTGRGLAASIEAMAARSSVPVDLRDDLPERLPEPVEVAVYYVVSESLANVGKHARASAVTVLLRRSLAACSSRSWTTASAAAGCGPSCPATDRASSGESSRLAGWRQIRDDQRPYRHAEARS